MKVINIKSTYSILYCIDEHFFFSDKLSIKKIVSNVSYVGIYRLLSRFLINAIFFNNFI